MCTDQGDGAGLRTGQYPKWVLNVGVFSCDSSILSLLILAISALSLDGGVFTADRLSSGEGWVEGNRIAPVFSLGGHAEDDVCTQGAHQSNIHEAFNSLPYCLMGTALNDQIGVLKLKSIENPVVPRETTCQAGD